MVEQDGIWQADGRAVFKLRTTGKLKYGTRELCNSVYMLVDTHRDETESADSIAQRIARLLNEDDEKNALIAQRDGLSVWVIQRLDTKEFFDDLELSWNDSTEAATIYTDPLDAYENVQCLVRNGFERANVHIIKDDTFRTRGERVVGVIILVEDHMLPIPDSIKAHVFGSERVVDENETVFYGKSVHVSGKISDLAKWLGPFDVVWSSNNPMMGVWDSMHVKEQLLCKE